MGNVINASSDEFERVEARQLACMMFKSVISDVASGAVKEDVVDQIMQARKLQADVGVADDAVQKQATDDLKVFS